MALAGSCSHVLLPLFLFIGALKWLVRLELLGTVLILQIVDFEPDQSNKTDEEEEEEVKQMEVHLQSVATRTVMGIVPPLTHNSAECANLFA